MILCGSNWVDPAKSLDRPGASGTKPFVRIKTTPQLAAVRPFITCGAALGMVRSSDLQDEFSGNTSKLVNTIPHVKLMSNEGTLVKTKTHMGMPVFSFSLLLGWLERALPIFGGVPHSRGTAQSPLLTIAEMAGSRTLCRGRSPLCTEPSALL